MSRAVQWQQNLGFVLFSTTRRFHVWAAWTWVPLPAARNKILVLNCAWSCEISSWEHHCRLAQLKSSHCAFNWSTGPCNASHSTARMPAAHCTAYQVQGNSWGCLTEVARKAELQKFLSPVLSAQQLCPITEGTAAAMTTNWFCQRISQDYVSKPPLHPHVFVSKHCWGKDILSVVFFFLKLAVGFWEVKKFVSNTVLLC